MAKMVIALGGNALGSNPREQKQAVKNTALTIADLIADGHEIIITHGNGPQVGMINQAFELSAAGNGEIPEMPFPECGAMSQGYIGYHLQSALREVNLERELDRPVTMVLTQVVVSEDDEAFDNPSKPIGSFYNREEAQIMEKEKGYNMVEDAGRGYRRVVPSPLPVDIVEKDSISTLMESGQTVIACGGGGIPVVREGNSLRGVAAVIDKDFASEKLAEIIEADILVILTAVDKVALNFGTAQEEWLSEMDVETAKKYCGEGHFAPGSMLPKVKAAIRFAESGESRKALITSLDNARSAIEGKEGTVIKK